MIRPAPDRASFAMGLTAGHWKLAELMLPGGDVAPPAKEVAQFERTLLKALEVCTDRERANITAIADRVMTLEEIDFDGLDAWNATATEDAYFVLTTAYYMCSEVREELGFPGQVRAPIAEATPDQVLDDELLAPVRARGPIYVVPPGRSDGETT
jgi:hypothetical protein